MKDTYVKPDYEIMEIETKDIISSSSGSHDWHWGS